MISEIRTLTSLHTIPKETNDTHYEVRKPVRYTLCTS